MLRKTCGQTRAPRSGQKGQTIFAKDSASQRARVFLYLNVWVGNWWQTVFYKNTNIFINTLLWLQIHTVTANSVRLFPNFMQGSQQITPVLNPFPVLSSGTFGEQINFLRVLVVNFHRFCFGSSISQRCTSFQKNHRISHQILAPMATGMWIVEKNSTNPGNSSVEWSTQFILCHYEKIYVTLRSQDTPRTWNTGMQVHAVRRSLPLPRTPPPTAAAAGVCGRSSLIAPICSTKSRFKFTGFFSCLRLLTTSLFTILLTPHHQNRHQHKPSIRASIQLTTSL